MNRILYLPIAATSLAHYISHAAIKPAAFLQNKPKDIQDMKPEYLLLTTLQGCTEAECVIEIELLEEETRRMTRVGNDWFLYRGIIPVTRIRSISFTDKEKRDNTIANIEMSTAFIPATRINITERFSTNHLPPWRLREHIDDPQDNCREQADMYNRLLGAFMLMKTVSPVPSHIPPAYFGLLGKICPRVAEEARAAYGERYVERYGSLFTRNMHNSKIKWLSANIDGQMLEKIAEKEGIKLEYDPLTKLVKPDNLPDELYVYSILGTYGVGQEARPKKIDELVLTGFTRLTKPNKSELVATYYGYNRGYAVFPKQFRSQSGYRTRITKFTFDNLVDCYTAESVYRHIFLDQTQVDCSDMEKRWPRRRTISVRRQVLDYPPQPIQRIAHAHVQSDRPIQSGWLNEAVESSIATFDPKTTTLYEFGMRLAQVIYKGTLIHQELSFQPVQTDTSAIRQQIVTRLGQLSSMGTTELRQTARALNAPIPPKATKQQLINAILLAEK